MYITTFCPLTHLAEDKAISSHDVPERGNNDASTKKGVEVKITEKGSNLSSVSCKTLFHLWNTP